MDKIRKLVLEVHSRYKQRHKTEDPEYKNKINANQRAKMKARLKRKAERLTRAAEAAGIPVEGDSMTLIFKDFLQVSFQRHSFQQKSDRSVCLAP